MGAGPAGSCAAYESARAGFKTVFLEEDRTVGVPVQCGEGVSAIALSNLGIEPVDEFVVFKIGRIRLFFPDGTPVVMNEPGFALRRDLFDQHLAERAVDAGAVLLTSAKASGYDRSTSTLEVATERGKEQVKCRVLIGCDGPKSMVAEWTGLLRREAWTANLIRAYELRTEGVRTDSFDFYFDPVLSPGGYLWVFPKGENVSDVGIATTAPDSVRRLGVFMKSHGFDGRVTKRTAGAIPAKGPLARSYGEGVMLAGDAAGQTNPLSFGGIHTAMQGGRLAGRTAVEALSSGDISEGFLARYEERWRGLPLGDPLLLKAANALYALSEGELRRLGKVLGGKDLDDFGSGARTGLLFAMLWPSNWGLLGKFPELQDIFDGLQITRKWGW